IARRKALNLREETPMLRHKTDRDIALGAFAHEERAAGDRTEADDAPKLMKRNAKFRFLFDANENGFTLLCKVGSLCSYKKRVEVVHHGPASPLPGAPASESIESR